MPRGRPRTSQDVECSCIVCGKKFVLTSWAVKMGRGKFCSRKCYHEPGEHRERPTLRVTPTVKPCDFCGKEMLLGGEGRGHYERQFCSNSCSIKWKHREGIVKGGSLKGRRVDHQRGYFERLNRTEIPTTWDIAWASGIYEGEGYCQLLKDEYGKPKTQHVGVGQKDRWLCDKLRDFFGGYVSDHGVFQNDRIVGKRNLKGEHKGYSWNIHGPRARGFLMTIYKFLSPRRQKRIREVLQTNQKIP